jgi:hypothetical protein
MQNILKRTRSLDQAKRLSQQKKQLQASQAMNRSQERV